MVKYDWLLFDLDNTILDFNKSSKVAFANLLEEIDSKLNAQELYPIYNRINRDIWEQREAGQISHDELKWKRWDLFFKKINIEFDPLKANERYFVDIKTKPFFVDNAKELLDEVDGRYKLMMITNGLSEVQWSRIELKNIKRYFEHIIISDEIGYAKPQEQFFKHCHQLIGDVDKSQVLVIGDTIKSDILGGNNFGYDTCWFDYYDEGNSTDIEPNFTIKGISELLDLI